MTQDSLDRINNYVTANQKRLKNICFKLYRGHYLWEDLFQEFYLKIIETPQEKCEKYKLASLCYLQILQLYLNRNRKNSNLDCSRFICTDWNMDASVDTKYNRHLKGLAAYVDKLQATQTPEYTLDIEEYIDAEMNKEHGFAEIMVFMEAQEKTLRELNKETGISLFSLCRYRQAGQKKLQNLLQCRI